MHDRFVSVAGIHLLGREFQELLSPDDGMHVCTDQASSYTLIRMSFREKSLQELCTYCPVLSCGRETDSCQAGCIH